MVGSYVATVARHSLNAQHGGRLDLTAGSTGALTGKLIIDGLGHSITGKLTATVNATTGEVAATANATIDIPRSNLPTLRLVVVNWEQVAARPSPRQRLPAGVPPASFLNALGGITSRWLRQLPARTPHQPRRAIALWC